MYGRARGALLDDEYALHTDLAVAGHTAIERDRSGQGSAHQQRSGLAALQQHMDVVAIVAEPDLRGVSGEVVDREVVLDDATVPELDGEDGAGARNSSALYAMSRMSSLSVTTGGSPPSVSTGPGVATSSVPPPPPLPQAANNGTRTSSTAAAANVRATPRSIAKCAPTVRAGVVIQCQRTAC